MISIRSVFLTAMVTSFAADAVAQSVASLPDKWRNWTKVKESFVPGNDVSLPEDTPLFLQETVRWVNRANNGQGTHSVVYVNPSKVDQYNTQGPYSDGPTAVGVFEDTDIVFVTEHLFGEPIYGVYSLAGEDISDRNPALAIENCVQCHSENVDICRGGTCVIGVLETFGLPGD